ncbi:MAG: hypothetical protein KDB57_06295 [Solirubrobacterales bacterium]|nr:hypothetical protein [Solirubrobacterales bacterium]
MLRKGPMIVVLCLLTLMGAAGLFDDVSGLLMLAPFLALLGLLLAGLYPGERIIEHLASALRARPWSATPPRLDVPDLRTFAVTIPTFGTAGPRAPPFFA